MEPRSQQDVLSPPAVPKLRFLLEKPSVHEVTETEQPLAFACAKGGPARNLWLDQ